MTKNIAAGIVLYNPKSRERFLECLESVVKQVGHIYIYDNSTENIEINNTFLHYDCITFISEKKNNGVSYALNRIMEAAEEDGYKWVITLDQDSIIPKNMISDFYRYTSLENVAIICPQILDDRRAYMKIETKNATEYVTRTITSGSLTSIDIWRKVGRFDEWLFIDLVDNEYCKRVIVSGYKIIRINRWVLNQQFGDIVPKSKCKQKFWINLSELLKIKNIAKFSYKKKVNPLRVYYTCRNIIYVNKKLKYYGKVGFESYNCKALPGFFVAFIFPSILRSNKKVDTALCSIRGLRDGIKHKVNPWSKE